METAKSRTSQVLKRYALDQAAVGVEVPEAELEDSRGLHPKVSSEEDMVALLALAIADQMWHEAPLEEILADSGDLPWRLRVRDADWPVEQIVAKVTRANWRNMTLMSLFGMLQNIRAPFPGGEWVMIAASITASTKQFGKTVARASPVSQQDLLRMSSDSPSSFAIGEESKDTALAWRRNIVAHVVWCDRSQAPETDPMALRDPQAPSTMKAYVQLIDRLQDVEGDERRAKMRKRIERAMPRFLRKERGVAHDIIKAQIAEREESRRLRFSPAQEATIRKLRANRVAIRDIAELLGVPRWTDLQEYLAEHEEEGEDA